MADTDADDLATTESKTDRVVRLADDIAARYAEVIERLADA